MNTGRSFSFRLSPFQTILIGFVIVILIGSFILMLPISSRSGQVTPFFDCLFMSTSVTCVTGLLLYDTAAYWSPFGQAVILCLIQIGGLGVVTVASSVAVLAGRKIGLAQRNTLQESISAPQIGGIVKYTFFTLKYVFMIEILGILLLLPVMIKDYGPAKGVWYSVFHAISAFCNAGVDLMEGGKSFADYSGNVYFNVVIMILVFSGGIGYLTWKDIAEKGIHISRYKVQSKLILSMSAALIVIPAMFFYFNDLRTDRYDMSGGERVMASIFTSVNMRTAGFSTIDYSSLSSASHVLMMMLILIGGAPGSTSGGIKITTFAVLVMGMSATFRRRESTVAFGRRIPQNTVRNAYSVFAMYIFILITAALLINIADGLAVDECLFETTSALGTTGIEAGIIDHMSIFSKIIVMFLAFWGRIGGLTLIYAAMSSKKVEPYRLPEEDINIG
ncbi:MAG: Trk family potassium uptake protein [Lachnospiraceae bacterium]|nr:Trk family potassium uptake protein [Lachnospiraceae bacterium]